MIEFISQLPTEYQEVEYLRSDGGQHIELDYIPNQNTKVKIDFMATNTDCAIFGSRIDYNNAAFTLYWSKTNSAAIEIGSSFYSLGSLADSNRHLVEMSNTAFIMDGSTVHTYSTGNFKPNAKFRLFHSGGTDSLAKMQGDIYSCEISEGYDLMCCLVACYRKADNEAGVYDIVNKVFYTNAGSGVFTVGANSNKHTIATITPGGIIPMQYALRRMMMSALDTGVTISALPVGAKVKDTGTTYYGSPIIWQVADKNHSGYPANSVTLIAANILKIAAFDAKESGNSDSGRISYGNNRYALSNIRQWLNKSGSPWYVAQHSADATPSSGNVNDNPYDGQSGFLTDFSAQMKAALLDTTLTVAKATVDGGGSESVVDKVFLLSKQEVGLGSENSIAEGSLIALFSSDSSSRLCKPTANAVSNSIYTSSNLSASQNWWWWLRSPYSSNSNRVRIVDTDGTSFGSVAYNGSLGVRPALNLSSGILISDSADSDGAYTIVWN